MHRMFSNVHLAQIWTNFPTRSSHCHLTKSYEISLQPGPLVSSFPYDSNLVFSRFISRGEVLCYNRAKMNSLILKCHENSLENQPITPKFVLYIVYILHYNKTILGFADIGSMITTEQEE
jgi:hypothetical protein